MNNPLEKRIAVLEEQIAELKKTIADLSNTKQEDQTAKTQPSEVKQNQPFVAAPKPIVKKATQSVKKDPAKSGEVWIGRLGIGLLLFGAAFLFKYSIDQGWITPLVRVLFGFALGVLLLVSGLRLYTKKKSLSRLLLGGGVATYYITIFSAFQLYHLFSHTTAFVLMAAVTLIAFLLALRQDEHTLSLIGALGGFLTPFLLYTGDSNTIGLITYTSLLVIGGSIIFMARGWRLLLWLSSWASWIIWAIAIDNTPNFGYTTDKWFIQGAIILTWFALAILPALREYWMISNPEKWRSPVLEFAYKRISKVAGDILKGHTHLLIISTPIIALLTTSYNWELSDNVSGSIIFAVSLCYLMVYFFLRQKEQYKDLNFTHVLSGIILLTWSLFLILEETSRYITIGLEAWAIFMMARHLMDKRMVVVAKILLMLTGFTMLGRVFINYPETPYIFNSEALADLLFIGLLTHAASKMKLAQGNILFFILAHLGAMGLLLRELKPFDNGQGLVTFTWGILAIIVFVLGLRQKITELRHMGSVTIAIVVGKLFLVDLSELETIWRIILFIGFGGILLFVSYFLEKLIHPTKEGDETKKAG